MIQYFIWINSDKKIKDTLVLRQVHIATTNATCLNPHELFTPVPSKAVNYISSFPYICPLYSSMCDVFLSLRMILDLMISIYSLQFFVYWRFIDYPSIYACTLVSGCHFLQFISWYFSISIHPTSFTHYFGILIDSMWLYKLLEVGFGTIYLISFTFYAFHVGDIGD